MSRLHRKNRILADIATHEKRQERSRNAIEELRRGGAIRDREFVEAQIEDHNQTISTSDDAIVSLQETLKRLDRGELDDDIQQEIDRNMREAEGKRMIREKREKLAAEQDRRNSKAAAEFTKKQRDSDYLNRTSLYQIQKEYERYDEMPIPPYIKDNLRTMPNNKGYIWKGIWMFGERPPEKSGPVVMFEKQHDVMFIHEIFEKEHHIYKKRNQAPKEYVKTVMRRPMKLRSGIKLNL